MPTARHMTLPALRSTLVFIVLDLVGVGVVGDAAAKQFGFDPSLLMPISALICIAAGYVATRRGAWGATAGSMVTSVEMLAYVLTGHHTPDLIPPAIKQSTVAVLMVLAASVAGAALGAIGGWLARRRDRVNHSVA